MGIILKMEIERYNDSKSFKNEKNKILGDKDSVS